MKHLLVAVLIWSSASAWALDDLVVENLRETREQVTQMLGDTSWLRGDQDTNKKYARQLELIHEQAELIALLTPPDDPAQAQILELKDVATAAFTVGEHESLTLSLFDALQTARAVLSDLASPVIRHDGPYWRESQHGKLLEALHKGLNDILRSYTGDIAHNRPRLQSTSELNIALQPIIDRFHFLAKLTSDLNLKASIERIGVILEERHAIVPNLAFPNARLAQERSSIFKAVEELNKLQRVLDAEGLNCEMTLAASHVPNRPNPLAQLLRSNHVPPGPPEQ